MNKKYIIIGLSLLLVVLCGLIAFEMISHVEYEKLVLPSGSTMEVPNDMKLVSDNSGTYVYESDECVVVVFNSEGKSLADALVFADDKVEIFGNDFERNTTVTDIHAYGCNLKGDYYAYYKANNETSDNVIVFAKNKEVGDYIINSIIYASNVNNESNAESTTVDEPTQEPSAYAYKSDGTPMYSQQEVNDYMAEKYGLCDYDIQDNGYIDIKEGSESGQYSTNWKDGTEGSGLN